MVAMVPEDFADGGPTEGLEGISARVACSFSYIAPTDFIRFWAQGPDDVSQNPDRTEYFRPASDAVPNDSRPRLRVLFHGEAPDTEAHRQNYLQMSPMGHVRRDVPPVLTCDGEQDPVVPGLHGKALFESLKAAGADATYWMTPGGGHGYPSGTGFQNVRDDFLARTLKLDSVK
jgi:acetyl esterase/lipase